ncbi:hypothetical protein OCH239_11370 [Roseivivax halodurans JCM 10272]|uniref:Uncharacterized protein n=1 Tax=Roseivivax halodurans JCM 10272 TaxID=1449350 RepID=X7EIM0_9RHOB|nr:hypothetical protein [Roseivivax halodurans]ETX15939.1 hypothetical protein OCH239_11370 [Roseivivax halodurans JCM 10272]
MTRVALLSLLALAACGGPDAPGESRSPNAADYFDADPVERQRMVRSGGVFPEDRNGDGVQSTGYVSAGFGSDGAIVGGGYLVRKGNFTLGIER